MERGDSRSCPDKEVRVGPANMGYSPFYHNNTSVSYISRTSMAKCCHSTRTNHRTQPKSAIRLRITTRRTLAVQVVLLLQLFLLNFAQGQGHGGDAVDQRVSFTIREGVPIGTLVGTIPVQDGLDYKFSEEPSEFTLDSSTGRITTRAEIDRERLSGDSIDLFITSVPSARHLIEVKITVIDINDNNPKFSQLRMRISYSETDRPGTQVILDTASDDDIGVNDVTSQYNIITGNEEGRFKLVLITDTSKPVLYLENTVELDREERENYQLNISAQDGGNPPRFGYLIVDITVADFNDNPPLFDQSEYSTTVNETAPVGTSLITVTATDRDKGPNGDITYAIVNDDHDQFAIDPKIGVITTLKKLTCERTCLSGDQNCKPKSCVVTVEARDNARPYPLTGRAYVTVSLFDENDHPPSISFRYVPPGNNFATVDEGADLNKIVTVVTVSDLDDGVNGQTTFSITKGNELGHFKMDPPLSIGSNMIGFVKVAGRLDREEISKYNLTIEARDLGSPSKTSRAFLIIRVNDINDHRPVFKQVSYSARLSELVPVGSFVAGLTATDNDTGINAQITYSIESGNELGWFKIDTSTGLVTTQRPLDRETKSSMILKISAQDGGSSPYTSYTNLSVSIWDENDEAPVFNRDSYSVTFEEEVQVATSIVTVIAVDNDQGKNGSIRYMLDQEVELMYPGLFQINQISGRVSNRRVLDHEEGDTYVIKVKAMDQGSPAQENTTTVYLNITDINDNKPAFYPVKYYASVLENEPALTSVVQVKATDKDSGSNGQILYSISAGAQQKFVIDISTGWISTTQQLDRETRSSYTLTVVARDAGGLQSDESATVEISVNDVMDTPPVFGNANGYSFSIIEDDGRNSPRLGRMVGQVSARTTDGSSITYSMAGGDKEGVFSINSATGVITTVKEIDRESASSYTLTVVAIGGPVHAETVVNITVTDRNDNSPTYTSTSVQAYVVENWPVGHDVHLSKAEDPDAGNNGKLTYTMSGMSSRYFSVDSTTGMIQLAKALTEVDETEFTVTVQVRDGGAPALSGHQTVTIILRDVNDHTPTYEQSSYEVSISESRPVNDRFFQVSATDSDSGMNGELTYQILSGNHDNIFGIFPDGVLYVAQTLDREARDLYVLTVRATDMGVEPRHSDANVTVHVLDDNDNAPHFANATYKFDLPEGSPVGTMVGVVMATDLDMGRNAELAYRLPEDLTGFSINPKTGVITSTEVYDREEMLETNEVDFITFNIIAHDNGEPRLQDTASVEVKLVDMNDNPPVFTQNSYEASLYENAEVNTQVLRVSAADEDAGDNAKVSYIILSGNDGNKFSIDDTTGQITLSAGLDREAVHEYVLVVMAMDAGIPPNNATAEARISVMDNNDNPPKFVDTETEFSIIETAQAGEYITEVSAVDPDYANNAIVSYEISAGNQGTVFHIDSNSGKIYLASSLDYEAKNRYVITITAADSGIPSLSADLQIAINVLDYNDNKPAFPASPIRASIQEGVAIGTSVAQVRATDSDSGINGELKYSIRAQEPEGRHFIIDADSGEITVQQRIDHEYSDNFRLVIVATDQAMPISARKSSEKQVTILVTDINDNAPEFVSMNAVPVLLGAQPNTLITQVSAQDPDSGENGRIEYEIFNGDTNIFRIDRSTGNLYLKSSLNSQVLTYDLTIQGMDQGSGDSLGRKSTIFQLTVFARASQENGPVFSQSSYSGQINENAAPDSSIVTVKANSASPTAQVEYFLTNISSRGTPQNRLFKIHPVSGLLTNTQELDRELGYDIFNVEIYAVDKSSSTPKTRSTVVQITLVDKNDSPPTFIPASHQLEVSEDVKPGHVLTTIAATDADQSGELSYRIRDGADGKIAIDSESGALSVLNALNREVKAVYNLRVVADDGVQSSEADVTIAVSDVNDERPEFTRTWYSFVVSEDTQIGTRVGQISATDKDEGRNADITYSILSHWGRDKFSLHPHTGIFTLVGALDYEEMEHYILTIRAQDSRPTPLSTTVSVYMNVMDENDNAPTFDPSTYSDEVWENATVGSSIMSVSATDIDSDLNGEVVYSIISGDLYDQFRIDPETGTISVANPLDREAQAYYSLAIRAVDKSPNPSDRLSSTALVSVILKDANDNAPVFESPSRIVVKENTPPGTAVFTLAASDLDEGRNGLIDYRITGGDSDVFSLGAVDGMLKVRRRLDRETLDTYSITVVASDKGLPSRSTSMTLTVEVGDDNDESPRFDPRTYTSSVREDVRVGTSLLTLYAADGDTGLNAEIRYLVLDGDDNQDFYVDSHTGEVSVQKHLDYERKQTYNIRVLAQDLGEPPRSDTATITVTVSDVNDCPPVFVDSPYTAYVQEHVADVPVHVLKLSARDDDSQVFSSLSYSIRDGDYSLFEINRTTGEIKAIKSLDREQQAEYELTITAHDSGIPRLTGTGSVKVLVGDMNDHAPEFHHSTYYGRVLENQPVPTSVVRVQATDQDTGKNADIRYSLLNDGEGKFSIHPVSGQVSTLRMLDREAQNSYNLVAMATDQGSISMSSTVPIKVTVGDANDNNPQFIKRSYTTQIQNPTPAGWFVLGVTAVDKDEGNNGELTYSMFGSNDVSQFSIDDKTGVITAKTRLSKTTGTYRFYVRVTDKGQNPLSDEITVEISFYPAGTTGFPIFTQAQQNFRVSELDVPGKSVTTVRATSPISSQIITYHISGGNAHDTFQVSTGGEVVVGKTLDYERTKGYSLWIEARDGSNPSLSSYTQLNINVEDKNDNVPVFEKTYYNVTIGEEMNPPISVVTVTAQDKDSGQNGRVSYEILKGNTNNAFTIDPVVGRIRTEMKLDRETTDTYKLVVAAVDHGQPKNTASATVDIHIEDKNDNPPVFTKHFYTRILENAPIGSFVIKITSTDADTGSNSAHAYTLSSNPGGKFAIDRESGNVTVAGYLDRESKDEYVLRVAANDGSYNAETQLSIDILDTNDNPPEFDRPSYRFNTVEGLPVGTSVGKVDTTDLDAPGPNSEVYYRFKTPTSLFKVDAETGEITTREVLEYKMAGNQPSTENTVRLTMLAIDHGDPPRDSEVSLTLSIRPANMHAPAFEGRNYTGAVAEDARTGEQILKVSATDEKDAGENAEIRYSISGGSGANIVEINPVTGWLSLSRPPSDNLPTREYTVDITASDQAQIPKSATTTVYIVITEINYYTPVFTGGSQPLSVAVSEDSDVGYMVTRVTATDRDQGLNGMVLYKIVSGDPDSHFSIDASSGWIKLAKEVDYETTPQYRLNVTASDRGHIPRSAWRTVVVSVTDVNDNPPVFEMEKYQAYIEENSPSGTEVLSLSATDADTPPNSVLQYYVTGEGAAIDRFTIQRDTGLLRSQGRLDYEVLSEYSVQVKVQNPGSLFSTTTVTVNVVSVNEFLPKFSAPEYLFTVSESTETGYTVGSVSATDEDSGPDGVVYYFLVGDSNTKGFSIDKHSGVVTISDVIDREATSEIVLDVLAKNAGPVTGNDTARCTVRVTVRDANDPPQFTQSVYETSIREHQASGISVLKVSAVDNDIQPTDSRFTYKILGGNEDNAFRLDAAGWIFTNGDLDRETTATHVLTVGAVDNGVPPLTGTATVRIHLDDVNDNGPYFEPEIPVGSLMESRSPYTDTVIDLKDYTRDPDLAPSQGPYRYRLVDSRDIFEVGASSGIVKSKVVLNRETNPEYKVKVEVRDGGSPPMSSTLTFKVEIKDVNDLPSTERPLKVTVFSLDGKYNGGKIADVKPNDPDIAGDYSCTLVEGDKTRFSIPRGCDLHVTQTQELGTYPLKVTGSDGKHNAVTYPVTVEFVSYSQQTVDNSVVVRLSQNSPSGFLKDSYSDFVDSVRDQVNDGGEPVVLGLQQDGDDVNLYVAVHYSQRYHLTTSQLVQKLTAGETYIENTARVTITSINYNPCTGSPCQNGATCTSELGLSENNSPDAWIVDSPALVLRTAQVALEQVCQCRQGYTGPRCAETINQCDNNPCKNGGTCETAGEQTRCLCTSAWTGSTCAEDVNECDLSPCKNNGRCINTRGSYQCECIGQFTGRNCEVTTDFCENSPCMNGGSCVTGDDGPYCSCAFGFTGTRCEIGGRGFKSLSYMEYRSVLSGLRNTISMEFATVKKDALLLYYPGSSREFLALEIIDGNVKFSFGLSSGQTTSVSIPKFVSDGAWYRVQVDRNGKIATLRVTDCSEDASVCEICPSTSNSCFSRVEATVDGSFSPSTDQLLIGGIKSDSVLTSAVGRLSSHDFVGCMRRLDVDSRDMFSLQPASSNHTTDTCIRTPQCSPGACENGGTCVDDWDSYRCVCPSGFAGETCAEKSDGFGLGPNSLVIYEQKEEYARDQKLGQKRRKRAVPSTDRKVSLKFRTSKSNGMLLYSSDRDGSKYTAILVREGNLQFRSGLGIEDLVIDIEKNVADAEWHNVTVKLSGMVALVSVDDKEQQQTAKLPTHDPLGVNVKAMTIGGSLDPVVFNSIEIDGFEGCLDGFLVDGESLPLDGATDQFTIRHVGEVAANCEGVVGAVEDPKKVPIVTVVIVIVVFFVVILVVILVTFFVLRWRRRKGKGGSGQPKQNGALKSNAGILGKIDGREQQDSGYTEDGNLSEGVIIGEHIASELGNRRYNEREIRGGPGFPGQRPDVVVPEATPISMDPGVENNGYDESPPEHYDIDNASSIAPSDLADVVSHYRNYRHANGMVNSRPKNKRATPSPNNLLEASRASPHSLGSLRASPNPMGMQNTALVHAPNNLNRPPSQLARASPRPNIPPPDRLNSPMAPSSLRSTPLSGITGLYSGAASNSSASYVERPLPNGHLTQPPRPGSHLRQPINPRSTPTVGLTVEEVNRLNARHKASPLATLDANSLSSDDPQQNINKTDFTHADLLDPAAHLPPESSSDESTNDSFTCSEFEQDNDKLRRDFLNPHRLAPRLAKVDENGDTDTSRGQNPGYDTISTFFTSDEDTSQSGSKFPQALNWDYLLNWGPNFEKLVGVFSDIAELPDSGVHVPRPPTSGRNSAQSPNRVQSPRNYTQSPSGRGVYAPSPSRVHNQSPRRASPMKHAQSPRAFSDSSSIGSSVQDTTPRGALTSPVSYTGRPPSRQRATPQMGTSGVRTPTPNHGAYPSGPVDRPPSRSQQERPSSRGQVASPTPYGQYGDRPPSRVKSPLIAQQYLGNHYGSDGNSPRSLSSDSPNASNSSNNSNYNNDSPVNGLNSPHSNHQEAVNSLTNGSPLISQNLPPKPTSPTKNHLAPLHVISEDRYDKDRHAVNGLENSFDSLQEEYV